MYNCTRKKTFPSNNEIPFALNRSAAVDSIIYFGTLLNITLYRRSKKKLQEELNNFVPKDLFNLHPEDLHPQTSGKMIKIPVRFY